MNEKQTKTVRLGLKLLDAAACVLAVIGSIGVLAAIGKINRLLMSAMSGSSSNELEAMSAMSSLTNIYSFLDLARFGAFAAFLISAFYAVIEIAAKSSEKKLSIIAAASSALGFVGCFLTSITAMYDSIISSSGLSSIMMSGMGSSSNTSALVTQLVKKMFGPMTVGGIFILIAAAAVIIFLTISVIKPKTAVNTYFNAAQAYPNQPYPNQQYPNQQYPNQQYPNSAYPAQQYPGQTYPTQAPSNDQPQNHNDFIPQ